MASDNVGPLNDASEVSNPDNVTVTSLIGWAFRTTVNSDDVPVSSIKSCGLPLWSIFVIVIPEDASSELFFEVVSDA